jgi:type I restriction enzyme S subunit
MATNQGCKGLIPTSQLDSKFLYYYLASIIDLLNALGTGATFKELSGSKLKEVPMVFPPLSEQQRIVGILDEAFDGIATTRANAQENLQNSRAVFESHLDAVFTERGKEWVDTTIGEQIHFIDYRGKTPVKTESGLRLITAKNVKMGYLQETPAEFIAPASYDAWMTRGIPRIGDVLFTTEAPLANVAQLDSGEKVAFAQRIIIMQTDPRTLDSTFLKYLLLSGTVQQRIRAKGTGATVQGIKASLLRLIEISFPAKLSVQRRIVAKLDALSEETQRLESIYQRKLAALDALKKSLLHQAFTGQLTEESAADALDVFPTRIANITPTDLHAGILAMAYQLHEKRGKQASVGHVKAEKIAHMVEALVGIDLGRSPIKDAAGPDDYPHFVRVKHRAEKAGFFSFAQVEGPAYQVTKLANFDGLVERTCQALGARKTDVERLLTIMVPMSTRQAEIFSTVFAAWNNLLLDRQAITDEKIVSAARDNWHPEKLSIPREKFFEAIKWMRKNDLVPSGKGKRVSGRG